MISAIFKAVQDGVTGFIGVLQTAFSGVGQLFIGSENELTFLGTLLLIAAGVGIVYFGFRLIKSLVGHAA